MSTSAVTLDGFDLIGTTPEGGRAKVTGFDGWFSSRQRRTRADRSSRPGSFSSRGLTAAAAFELSGQITYASASACATERRRLLALVDGGSAPLVVTDALGTLGISVEMDDADVVPLNDRFITYTFVLGAMDPFATAQTATVVAVGAGLTVPTTSPGTAAAEIEVTTTSAGTVDLTIGSLRLRTQSLPSGSVLTSGPGFDNPKRTIRGPAGDNLFGLIVQPMGWPAIAPGANSLVNGGTADLSVRYFPTYA